MDAIDGKIFLAGQVRIDDIVLAAIIVRRAVHAACLAIKGLTSALEVSGSLLATALKYAGDLRKASRDRRAC